MKVLLYVLLVFFFLLGVLLTVLMKFVLGSVKGKISRAITITFLMGISALGTAVWYQGGIKQLDVLGPSFWQRVIMPNAVEILICQLAIGLVVWVIFQKEIERP
jgi:hypothetical protein